MKVDVTKIENYEAMTPEEKLEAVLNFDIEVPQAEPPKSDDADKQRLKDAFNKASSEAAEYKRQLRAKETAEETAKREQAEAQQKLMDELTTLRKEKAMLRKEKATNAYTANYMSIGYDVETAKALASTLPEGLPDEFFTSQKTFIDNTIQNVKAQVLNQQPQPTQGSPLTGKQAEDLEYEKLRKWAGLK